jgi:hypothetical protein
MELGGLEPPTSCAISVEAFATGRCQSSLGSNVRFDAVTLHERLPLFHGFLTKT